jgi:hypothetical protein
MNEQDRNIIEKEIREKISKRFKKAKENEYLTQLLTELVINNVLPIDLTDEIPIEPEKAGKSRFDQIYDAVMDLAFPGYGKNTVERLTGTSDGLTDKTKIWRIILPEKFKVPHVLIRADSYQEAFGKACDYVCRISLRIHGKIPSDLQIRVIFVSEKAIRRHLKVRWANRLNKRKRLNLVGREFTPKEIEGAKFAALGDPKDGKYRIAKYMEEKDLKKIKKKSGKTRISSVEHEAASKSEE